MPRPRERVCLQDGLRLDLNRLRRRGWVSTQGKSGPHFIRWMYTYTGELLASGFVSAEIYNEYEGRLRIQLDGSIDQWIDLRSERRHFGGRQWYFMCPRTHRHVSVLWRPPGASRFCSRQTWGRRVAYATQFETPSGRAWQGKAKIKSRLIADLDPDDWDLPPKPKWMRWRTYEGYLSKYDYYEDVLDRVATG